VGGTSLHQPLSAHVVALTSSSNWAALPAPLPPVAPYCILFVGANNANETHLNLEGEMHQMENAFFHHQEKTCEVITPYGVITQFPKNGRLFTPKYRLITPLTFDHTVIILFTPSILKITP
jgi:hypothetical protein